MRSYWILVPVALLAFGPANTIAQQTDPAAPVTPAKAEKPQQAPAQPASTSEDQKKSDKKVDTPPTDTSEQDTAKPVKTNPFAPENNKPKVKSDNPFPTDDAPMAPMPKLENLPPADGPKPGQVGWSSSLDRADSAVTDANQQSDTSAPPVTTLDLEIRAKEDLKVARYYASIGSWKGALSRYQNAFAYAKDDEDVVCGLAEAERHLGFQNEAILHYTECLHLDPAGAYSRSAQKALKSLTSHR